MNWEAANSWNHLKQSFFISFDIGHKKKFLNTFEEKIIIGDLLIEYEKAEFIKFDLFKKLLDALLVYLSNQTEVNIVQIITGKGKTRGYSVFWNYFHSTEANFTDEYFVEKPDSDPFIAMEEGSVLLYKRCVYRTDEAIYEFFHTTSADSVDLLKIDLINNKNDLANLHPVNQINIKAFIDKPNTIRKIHLPNLEREMVIVSKETSLIGPFFNVPLFKIKSTSYNHISGLLLEPNHKTHKLIKILNHISSDKYLLSFDFGDLVNRNKQHNIVSRFFLKSLKFSKNFSEYNNYRFKLLFDVNKFDYLEIYFKDQWVNMNDSPQPDGNYNRCMSFLQINLRERLCSLFEILEYISKNNEKLMNFIQQYCDFDLEKKESWDDVALSTVKNYLMEDGYKKNKISHAISSFEDIVKIYGSYHFIQGYSNTKEKILHNYLKDILLLVEKMQIISNELFALVIPFCNSDLIKGAAWQSASNLIIANIFMRKNYLTIPMLIHLISSSKDLLINSKQTFRRGTFKEPVIRGKFYDEILMIMDFMTFLERNSGKFPFNF